ncbi:nitroreductase/quinone reductase family protein [Nocardia coffeae]|uniref:nitroreductase/quinone reductase family protein n=1 Tax=Nocardia coffeae TaxID=2873381 RepID=UPI001F2F7586|nr:nitroreductase/quinone reductase family protein [Nocardia coffeae]
MALSAKHRIRNRVVVALHRIGLPVGPMYLLTVAGRASGRPRTTPVAPVLVEGVHYLVQAYPNADWVKNARTAGRGTLARGRRAQDVNLIELPEPDRGPILREFPRQNPRGTEAFIRNGLVDSASPESFAGAADRCPVFRIAPIHP